jgi:hypothetical protein
MLKPTRQRDVKRITLETTRAEVNVFVHTLWQDNKVELKRMPMHEALEFQLTYITQVKAITIYM